MLAKRPLQGAGVEVTPPVVLDWRRNIFHGKTDPVFKKQFKDSQLAGVNGWVSKQIGESLKKNEDAPMKNVVGTLGFHVCLCILSTFFLDIWTRLKNINHIFVIEKKSAPLQINRASSGENQT